MPPAWKRTQSALAVESSHKAVLNRSLLKVCTFFFAAVLVYTLLGLALLSSARTTVEKSYDASFGLAIYVSACDVELRPAQSARIRYISQLSDASYLWNYDTSSGLVTGGRFALGSQAASSGTCETRVPSHPFDAPGCRRVCLVQIDVPPAASSLYFYIHQPSSDASVPRVSVLPGVAVGTLRVSGFSINVDVAGATVASRIWTVLASGNVRIDNTTARRIDVQVCPRLSDPDLT
jgi:hypothetical protein